MSGTCGSEGRTAQQCAVLTRRHRVGVRRAGPSPVDRRKGGLKRSVCVEGRGIPLGVVSAGANRHDSPLLEPTLRAASAQAGTLPDDVTAHLDAAYDSGLTRELLDDLGLEGEIARKGIPSPIQVGKRWVVERTNSLDGAAGRRSAGAFTAGDLGVAAAHEVTVPAQDGVRGDDQMQRSQPGVGKSV
jgi:Transposase DDE domain